MLKPESVDKLTNFFGIKSDEEIEPFINDYDKKFVPRDKAHEFDDVKTQATGERMKMITAKLRQVLEDVVPGVSFADLHNKRVEENLDFLKEKFTGIKTDLESKLKDGSDKRVNDLTKQMEDKDKTISAYKEANEKLSTEYDTFKTTKETDIKKYKIGHQLNEVKSRIAFRDDVTDIEREGFNSYLNNNFQFDLDEKDNLLVKDKEGKPILNKKAAGKISEPFDIMSEIAESNKLMKKNNAEQGAKKVIFTNEKSKTENLNDQLSETYKKRLQEFNHK